MASMHDSVRFKTTVYAAIELSKKSWVVAIARPDRDRTSIHRIVGGNLADLIGRLCKALAEISTHHRASGTAIISNGRSAPPNTTRWVARREAAMMAALLATKFHCAN